MIRKILEHFEKIGVDVIYNKEEDEHSFEFYAYFDLFEAKVQITVDQNTNNLSCECNITGFPYAEIELYEAINMLNKDSLYFKAYYNNIFEEVRLISNQIYNDNNILYIIDLLLESLISTEIEYIKNIYKYSHDRIPDDIKKIIDDSIEE